MQNVTEIEKTKKKYPSVSYTTTSLYIEQIVERFSFKRLHYIKWTGGLAGLNDKSYFTNNRNTMQ